MSKTAMCWGFDCGDGWFDILDRLSARISELDPDCEALQVKEKFGTLRFYHTSGVPAVEKAVDDAEAESAATCEECGKPGQLRGKGWLVTRCDEHWGSWSRRSGRIAGD